MHLGDLTLLISLRCFCSHRWLLRQQNLILAEHQREKAAQPSGQIKQVQREGGDDQRHDDEQLQRCRPTICHAR